ncbi:hypothetical protein CUMW_157960 [Citrus unshiu]|uniref:Maturase MatK N-terminal domain-containing protein n=1 Tax=Citrus unshiu TaxID=55188 RepID=A0A2H5PQH0_CITUN|nr:hypothetical protein CUMW_157960 [Citrus unshiu]
MSLEGGFYNNKSSSLSLKWHNNMLYSQIISEGKLSHLNYVLDVPILHLIFPEILVKFLDNSSLHLLWFLLHEYFNSNALIIPKKSISIFSKSNPRLLLFLYNSHYWSSNFGIRAGDPNQNPIFCHSNKFIYYRGGNSIFPTKGKKFPINSFNISFFENKLSHLYFASDRHWVNDASSLHLLGFFLISDYRYSFKKIHTNKIVIPAYSCLKTNLVVLHIMY